MNFRGKATINPVLFYTGKVSGYITWGILILSSLHVANFPNHSIIDLKYIALIVFLIGVIFSTISLINLGRSTRFGLPVEKTTFRTNGIYRLSRNPMYFGFNCFTLAAILFTLNTAVILLGIYSMVIYHFIILGEEKFLENRFGNEYIEYKKKVQRYL
ncbi:MAG: isoprenylcysteine carboxylmethyltransferase family protein [archaeon]